MSQEQSHTALHQAYQTLTSHDLRVVLRTIRESSLGPGEVIHVQNTPFYVKDIAHLYTLYFRVRQEDIAFGQKRKH